MTKKFRYEEKFDDFEASKLFFHEILVILALIFQKSGSENLFQILKSGSQNPCSKFEIGLWKPYAKIWNRGPKTSFEIQNRALKASKSKFWQRFSCISTKISLKIRQKQVLLQNFSSPLASYPKIFFEKFFFNISRHASGSCAIATVMARTPARR